MKYLQLFELFRKEEKPEKFQFSKEESWEYEKQINKVLNDKSEDLKYIISGWNQGNVVKVSTPKIQITNNKELDRQFYLYNLTIGNHDRSINVTMYNNIDGKQGIEIYKNYSLRMEKDEVSKLLRMLDHASDYMGGIKISPNVESQIYKFLDSDETKKEISL